MTAIDANAWNTYADSKPQRRPSNAAGELTWFNWTQYPDHGPGVELLGLRPGDRALDLGCGSGGNAAHLASLGVGIVGVDVSTRQLAKARERWPDTAGMDLHHEDALTHLRASPGTYAAVYSVFGAVYFSDPAILLPATRAALVPGGRLVFSQRPAVEGCYGAQASLIQRGPDEDPAVVRRWDHEPGTWIDLLRAAGFVRARAEILPAPPDSGRTEGTLLVRALRPGLPRREDPEGTDLS
ncbi:class I SAM-dependent methyltransferase [Streptomyces lonarensis]|uniref:Class I SAM-dependent methyltransferase n=1 Tax=Streptomyces lonarensis TaxID=700599 RepID=A0A7X6HY25_9ACTN|nr:class I SAM-dependent methyltransferase [Streptomyces lonarensis]NJQ04739.1 class I SAM-dependent methyltransferase [Streptomyces lonarensis]